MGAQSYYGNNKELLYYGGVLAKLIHAFRGINLHFKYNCTLINLVRNVSHHDCDAQKR